MADGSYSFQYLEDNEDVEQELELMRSAFGENEGVDDLVRRLIEHHPYMSLRDHFVLKHGGRVVASLNLIPQLWSLGGVSLKVAEMGCVATHPSHRRRGLQRKLVEKFNERVSKDEFDLSVIEGIPYFYRQFGYEYAVPLDEEVTIMLEDLPEHKIAHEVRPFTDEDIPGAMTLLGESQRGLLVHSMRDEEIWRMQQRTGFHADWPFDGYVLENDGEMCAYFRISRKRRVLLEASGTDQSAANSILGYVKELGRREGWEAFKSRLSGRDPITAQLLSLGATKSRSYAWQLRVIDHERLFRRLIPLFNRRISESPFSRITEALTLNFYKFTMRARLKDGLIEEVERLDRGEGSEIRLNPYVFPQLLTGHRSIGELQSWYPDVFVADKRREIVDTLFPKGASFIHPCY